MKFLKSTLCVVIILTLAFSLVGCGGNSIAKALDMKNFETVQITASYQMEDLEAEEEETTSSSASSGETSSDGVMYNDVEMDENSESAELNEDLKYKRNGSTYYEYAFGNEFYFFEEGGKHYRIISQPDYSNPEAFQNLWYKQEATEEAFKSATTFNYDAFESLEKDFFKKKGNTYTLKQEYINEFINDLLKMDMADEDYSNPSVRLTVEDNQITEMCIKFLREERYQFEITYNIIYNDLKVKLPECTDKELILY